MIEYKEKKRMTQVSADIDTCTCHLDIYYSFIFFEKIWGVTAKAQQGIWDDHKFQGKWAVTATRFFLFLRKR